MGRRTHCRTNTWITT